MIKEIETELKLYSDKLFTGQLKFGVEHGIIRALSVTTKVDRESVITSQQQKDVFNELTKVYPDESDFYGSVEFYFNFGKVIASNYSVNLQGELLQEQLRKHQCRSVKVVVKK